MTTHAHPPARIVPLVCLLAATLFLLMACGKDDAPKTADAAGDPSAYLHPVGTLSEVDARLFEAAGKGDSEGLAQAMEAGANVNVADKLKRTPLFATAFFNRAETAGLLIDRGAEVNATDANGFSPLHAGVVAGGKEVVAVLIARGADINDRTVGGRTALHLAAATDQPALVSLLLGNGANAHAKDREGLTPAALAAKNGHAAVSTQIRHWAEKRSNRQP